MVYNCGFRGLKMSGINPAQVYAAIRCNAVNKESQKLAKHAYVEDKNVPRKSSEITVTAKGELSLPPDRCRLYITISSAKETVQDVKNSVTRRLDYILQVLNNEQVKVSKLVSHLLQL